MQDKIKDLKTSLLAQAKYFLEEANEFYPFAAAITKDNRLKPIGAYFEDDYPASNVVLGLLEKAIFDGLQRKEFLLAAIASDMLIDIDNSKQSALQIRIFDENGNEISHSFHPYVKSGETYSFQETRTD